MDKLTEAQARILAVLDDEGGFTTRDVNKNAKPFPHLEPRISSAWCRNELLRLKKLGMARELDDQKPACWVRTEAGRSALSAAKPTQKDESNG